MKLTIKQQEAAIPGGVAYLLCDEHGEALPNQLAASIKQEIEEFSTITVTFSVDGEQVSIG